MQEIIRFGKYSNIEIGRIMGKKEQNRKRKQQIKAGFPLHAGLLLRYLSESGSGEIASYLFWRGCSFRLES